MYYGENMTEFQCILMCFFSSFLFANSLYPSWVYYMSQSQHLFTMALLTVTICLVDSSFLSVSFTFHSFSESYCSNIFSWTKRLPRSKFDNHNNNNICSFKIIKLDNFWNIHLPMLMSHHFLDIQQSQLQCLEF